MKNLLGPGGVQSRSRRPLETTRGRLGSFPEALESVFGGALRRLEGVLGYFGSVLGRLGAAWGSLEAFLGAQGADRAHFGGFLKHIGRPRAILGANGGLPEGLKTSKNI